MKKFLSILSALFIILNTCVVFAESDAEYKTLVEPKFDDAQFFSEGYAPVCVNGKWGYIDKTGKYLVEPKYDYASIFSEGKAVVGNIKEVKEQEGTDYEYTRKYCELGFINTDCEYTPLLSEARHLEPYIYEYNNGSLTTKRNTDTTIVKPEFELAYCLFEYDWENDILTNLIEFYYINDYLLIETTGMGDDNNAWIFNSEGKMIDQYITDYRDNGEYWGDKLWGILSDGLISGQQYQTGINDKINFYDKDLNLKFSKYTGWAFNGTYSEYDLEELENVKNQLKNIDYFYDGIYPFNNGYAGAWVTKNESRIEEHTYKSNYDNEYHTYYELIAREYDEEGESCFALIDKTGNIVFTGDYTRVMYTSFKNMKVLNNGRIVLKNRSDKWGAVDKAGNVVIPFEYDEMGVFMDTVTSAKKDGVWYLIDIDGNVISKTDYDYLAGRNPENKVSIAMNDDEMFTVLDNKKIKGSEKIAKDKYYNTDYGVIVPDDTIITKDGDKYGYAMLNKVSVIEDYADKIDVKKHINNDTLTLSVNVKDNCEMPNLTMYLVSRNKNNGLYSIKTDKKSSSDDDTIELSVDIPTSKSYKFMLWDDELQPLINPVE